MNLNMNHRRRRILIAAMFTLTLLAIVGITARLRQPGPSTVATTSSKDHASEHIRYQGASYVHLGRSTTASGNVTTAVQLEGYSRPIALTGDPELPGVWFISANATQEVIGFYNAATSTLHTYPFGSSSNPLYFGAEAGLAVAPDGTVWAGIDSTLLKLDPTTGAIVRIAIPAVPPDASSLAGSSGQNQPASLLSTHAVQSLALEQDGDLMIAMSFTPSISVYNTASGVFSLISLPDNDLPGGIAAFGNNGLVVSSANDGTLDVLTSDGAVLTEGIASSANVGCNENVCATSPDGENLLSFVPSSVSVGQSPSLTELSETVDHLIVGGMPTPLSGNAILAPTSTGFAILNEATGSTDSYQLPSYQCSAEAVSSAASQSPTEVPCQETPEDYAVDSVGNIWFTANSGEPAIYELASNDYAAAHSNTVSPAQEKPSTGTVIGEVFASNPVDGPIRPDYPTTVQLLSHGRVVDTQRVPSRGEFKFRVVPGEYSLNVAGLNGCTGRADVRKNRAVHRNVTCSESRSAG